MREKGLGIKLIVPTLKRARKETRLGEKSRFRKSNKRICWIIVSCEFTELESPVIAIEAADVAITTVRAAPTTALVVLEASLSFSVGQSSRLAP